MSEDTALEFPCEFPIKMMGIDTPEFRSTARALVEKHAGPVDDTAVKVTSSRTGRFVSVTVTFSAQSREQLDNLYREVTAHDAVLVAL
jgi:putative lipoic acid-binding regulatory protein